MQQDTPQTALRVIACPSLFSMERGRVDRLQRPAGGSLVDLLRSINWERERSYTRVFLDGRLVEDAAWETVIPHAGQSVIVRAIPSGGQSGKDWARMAAMIGVMAAAIAVTGGAGTVLIPGLVGGYAAGAGLAISIIGTLAVTAKIPPPLPRRCDQVPHE